MWNGKTDLNEQAGREVSTTIVYKQLLHVLLNNTMGLMSKTKSRLWT